MPCFRFYIPLIEPDGRISRIRLSDKTSRRRTREAADNPVGSRVLEVLQPAQMQIALMAQAAVENQDKTIDRQWQMRLERADYEAQLAQRRYEEIDPAIPRV